MIDDETAPSSDAPNSTPNLETMQQAAENLLRQRVLSKGGRQPDDKTVKAAARVMAGRAMRELQAKKT